MMAVWRCWAAFSRWSNRAEVPKVSTIEMVVPRNVSNSSLSDPFIVRLRPKMGILNFTFINDAVYFTFT